MNVILKRFDDPEETREFPKGKFDVIHGYIPPGHDSRVVGDEPYVSLHFLGAEKYAEAK